MNIVGVGAAFCMGCYPNIRNAEAIAAPAVWVSPPMPWHRCKRGVLKELYISVTYLLWWLMNTDYSMAISFDLWFGIVAIFGGFSYVLLYWPKRHMKNVFIFTAFRHMSTI